VILDVDAGTDDATDGTARLCTHQTVLIRHRIAAPDQSQPLDVAHPVAVLVDFLIETFTITHASR
jgi:hypothetical protein